MFRAVKTQLAALAALAALWIVLTGGDAGSWVVGVPVVAAGAWLWARLGGGAVALRPAAFPGLALFFLRYSVKGGWDVAKRALSTKPRLCPELVPFDTQLPEGSARILLINCVSLMPGTTTVEREEGHLRLHVLDASQPYEPEIRALEGRIARLFRLPLSEPDTPPS